METSEYAAINTLLQQGGIHYNVSVQDSTILPVHRTARLRDVKMLQLLLNEVPVRARSDFLNTQTDYGYTALHWCAVFDSPTMTRELIIQGCDTSILNYRGKTAWDVAEAAQAKKVLNTIMELAHSGKYPLLREEQERRMHRPNVAEFFRDDISLDQMRFMMWGTPQTPFSQWDFLAEGGFGKVFKVKDVSPPIESNGRQFSVVAVKIPKPEGVDELKAEVEALSKLAHENVCLLYTSPSPRD